MNKTIYIRDEDLPIWERARELAGDKLSPAIVAGLKRFVADKEAEEAAAKGFERISVKFNDADDHYIPRVKAFVGKWIIPLDKPARATNEDGDRRWSYSVAITAKGAAVFFWVEEDRDTLAEHFKVFPSLESAAADHQLDWTARKAIQMLGVPVDELDI